jgi:hypothetical protein
MMVISAVSSRSAGIALNDSPSRLCIRVHGGLPDLLIEFEHLPELVDLRVG